MRVVLLAAAAVAVSACTEVRPMEEVARREAWRWVQESERLGERVRQCVGDVALTTPEDFHQSFFSYDGRNRYVVARYQVSAAERTTVVQVEFKVQEMPFMWRYAGNGLAAEACCPGDENDVANKVLCEGIAEQSS